MRVGPKLRQTPKAEAESSRARPFGFDRENVGHPIVVCDALGNFILFNRRAELLFQESVFQHTRYKPQFEPNAVKLTPHSGLASASETGRRAGELIDPTLVVRFRWNAARKF